MRLARAASYALVLVLSVELAVWGSFLVASRPFGYAFPVAALVALVGNLAVGVAGARVLGRPLGAVVPGLIWLGIALSFGSGTSEGDRVVTTSFRGFAFLVAGTLAATVPIGAIRATSRRPDDR